MNGWLRYVGNSAARVLSKIDLSGLGAEAKALESLGENAAVSFVRGVAQHIEPQLADFIANHPMLQGEFHTLSDDEAQAEVAQRTGNSGGSSTPTSSSSTNSGSDNAPSTSDSSAASGDSTTAQTATSDQPTSSGSARAGLDRRRDARPYLRKSWGGVSRRKISRATD
jgi:hypothetical protein